MPAYNAERTIHESIDSVLSQQYTDFELFIVDDASIDGTSGIVQSFTDDRIHLIRLEKNSGVSVACNTALVLAKSEYIARTDADDIWLPERLTKGVEYLDSHPNVGVVGGNIEFIDAQGKTIHAESPVLLDSDRIKWALLYRNTIRNSTILARNEAFRASNYYDPELRASHDYDLWNKIAKNWIISNIPEKLVKYRRSDHQLTSKSAGLQHENHLKVMSREFTHYLGYTPNKEILDLLAFPRHKTWQDDELLSGLQLLIKLYSAYVKKEQIESKALQAVREEAVNHALLLISRLRSKRMIIRAKFLLLNIDPKYILHRGQQSLYRHLTVKNQKIKIL